MEGVVRIDALCKHELNHLLLLRGAQLSFKMPLAVGSIDGLLRYFEDLPWSTPESAL